MYITFQNVLTVTVLVVSYRHGWHGWWRVWCSGGWL